ncbi:single myb histone 1 [Lactuca sativa]|nr:single myb histone 1 [Lactuca sativa]
MHRWTLEEENALRAGVDKYGTGKWMKILTDEDLAPCLIARTNIDLKDKWRNLCGNASRRAVSLRCSTDKKIGSGYDAKNLKALPFPSTNNSDGLHVVADHSYTKKIDIQELVDEENQNVEVDIKEAIQSMKESGYNTYEVVVTLQNLGVQHPSVEAVNESKGEAIEFGYTGVVKKIQKQRIRRYSERIVKKKLSKKVYRKDGKGSYATNPLNLD